MSNKYIITQYFKCGETLFLSLGGGLSRVTGVSLIIIRQADIYRYPWVIRFKNQVQKLNDPSCGSAPGLFIVTASNIPLPRGPLLRFVFPSKLELDVMLAIPPSLMIEE